MGKKISKNKQERIKAMLKDVLKETNKMFEEKEQPNAYIIGYLEGAIKTVIEEL